MSYEEDRESNAVNERFAEISDADVEEFAENIRAIGEAARQARENTELIGVSGEFDVYVHTVQHASAEDLEIARMCAASRERKAWLLLQEAEKHLARCIEHWNNAQTELFSYGPKN